jgi:hypothetical protein
MCDTFKARNNFNTVETIFIDKDFQEIDVLRVSRT